MGEPTKPKSHYGVEVKGVQPFNARLTRVLLVILPRFTSSILSQPEPGALWCVRDQECPQVTIGADVRSCNYLQKEISDVCKPRCVPYRCLIASSGGIARFSS